MFDPTQLAEIRKQTPDFKESFDIGRDNCPRISNVWLPEHILPGFREAASTFQDTCRHFEIEKLLPALSLGLELPGGGEFLGKYHQEGENQLRLLHYPAAPAEVFARGEKGRVGAHTVCEYLSSIDYVSLTMKDRIMQRARFCSKMMLGDSKLRALVVQEISLLRHLFRGRSFSI